MKKGFTLIELAIVLIIIGLLTGGSFQLLQTMEAKARDTQAKQTLEAAKEAVIAFAINNGRLPATLAQANIDIQSNGDTNISYYVPSNIAPFLITNLCQSNDTTFSTQKTNPDDTLGSITSNIAFVLAVNGENMQPQTLPPSATFILDNPVDLIFPRWNATNGVYNTSANDYDDFHTEVTLAELQSIIVCQPLRIINPQLPVGDVNSTYSAQIISEGGTGVYTYSFNPSVVNGYTLPSNGLISHTWATPVAPTAIDINVTSGTMQASRRYVLQIE